MSQSSPTTRVWTPTDDPRQAAKPVVVPAKVAKEPPMVRIRKPTPAPAAKPAEPKPAKASAAPVPQTTTNPRKIARHQIKALAKEHGLSLDYARLAHSGEWSLELAIKRTRMAERAEAQRRALVDGDAVENQLLKQWIKASTPLIRIETQSQSPARLEQVETFEWRWSDSPEPQQKIATLAVMSEESHALWSPQWQLNLDLQAQALEVAAHRKQRSKVGHWRIFDALAKGHASEIHLLNGLIISGYVRWINNHSLGYSQTLEGGPFLFIPKHGIYAFKTIRPALESAVATPAEARAPDQAAE